MMTKRRRSVRIVDRSNDVSEVIERRRISRIDDHCHAVTEHQIDLAVNLECLSGGSVSQKIHVPVTVFVEREVGRYIAEVDSAVWISDKYRGLRVRMPTAAITCIWRFLWKIADANGILLHFRHRQRDHRNYWQVSGKR